MKKATGFFVFFSSIILFSACSVIDPNIPVPAYLHIGKINLTTNYGSQGTDSAKITDAWVYVNNQYIGTFQMPATVPVLSTGNDQVSVDAGIEVSGISSNRAAYPFYSQYTQNLTLIRGQKTTISPTVKYLPQTVFAWMEDFESVGISLTKSSLGRTDTVIKRINTRRRTYFRGGASGGVFLDNTHIVFEATSASVYKLSSNADSSSYLELNYKSNNSFVIGLYPTITTDTPLPVLTINPSAKWNKIYVSLTPTVLAAQFNYFYVYIFMTTDSAVTLPALYLDNIKLVHF